MTRSTLITTKNSYNIENDESFGTSNAIHCNWQAISAQSTLYNWLQVALVPRVGIVTMARLLNAFGSIDNILLQDEYTLHSILGNKGIAQAIRARSASTTLAKCLSWLEESSRRHIIRIGDANYPKLLQQIANPPLFLFTEGKVDLLANDCMAVVGTRHPSRQGALDAYRFANDLAKSGITVISGLASGIDRQAHLGALKATAKTIAVIGNGIDVIYPKSNQDLYQQIIAEGLLISEFHLNTQPLASNFPRRNRIVAGSSLGCLVVESAIDGGSLITANLALEMGREVMAVPGSIHNPASHGCHKLIKQGAKLVENVRDILEELAHMRSPMAAQNKYQGDLCDIVTQEDMAKQPEVLDFIGHEPTSIDAICANLKVDFADVCASILELELAGKIANCGDGYYQRIFS